MGTPKEILDLIDRFEANREAYRAGQYNETQLRREFLDPLFKALGWDIDNRTGYAEAYKDVIHEDQIRVGGVTKAPDYCFRIGGARKFFLEAKKPSTQIKDEPAPAYQLRRYAWSAKLPLSILSDFEEFAIYDGRVKPFKTDSASTARVFYCTFRELAEKWEWLASVFSRDAVLKGSFDKYAESTRVKRGTAEVDADFLASMEQWRADLARNLALRNPKLTQRELNFAVQRVLDRVIFLRICEDRGIEDYGRLRGLLNGERIYPRLCQLFQQADTRYNSGLFHFQPEKERSEPPDNLTLELELDDKLLRELLRGLYYPDSPYEFSVITGDILGQVYEQFLGKVIRLTDGHRAVVEEKPEVRKAGGVYYTPTYIVEYIVRESVGRLLIDIAGKSAPRRVMFPGVDRSSAADGQEQSPPPPQPQTKAAPMDSRRANAILERVGQLRILDPACGSGSFLIGAYQYLLDWHLDFYLANDPTKWAKGRRAAMVQTHPGWRLTIAERKRILLNNIYGVDIDPQAVEVTKLSLLLKVLEGETRQTVQSLLGFLHERALPDLGNNIKCGNSLIGPDFYEQPELPLLTDDDRLRINVFDWLAEFPHILRRQSASDKLQETPAAPLDYTWPGVPLHGAYASKPAKASPKPPTAGPAPVRWEGGFDVVIGNPPYVRQESLSAYKSYFGLHYEAYDGVADLYAYFMERGVQLLRDGGLFSVIVSSSFLRATYGEPLRRALKRHAAIRRIVDFGGKPVFTGAKDTYVCIPLLEKGGGHQPVEVSKVGSLKNLKLDEHVAAHHYSIPHERLSPEAWSLKSDAEAAVFDKIMQAGKPLGDCVGHRFYRGITSGFNEAFIIDAQTREELITQNASSDKIIHPLLGGEDIRRYVSRKTDRWIIFTRRGVDLTDYPAIRRHLEKWKEDLTPKSSKHANRGRKPGRYAWFEIQDDVAYYEAFDCPKIIFPDICKGPRFSLDTEGHYLANTAYCLGTDDRYLLGVLNSRLFWFAISNISIPFGIRAGQYRYRLIYQYMEKVPIRVMDLSNPTDRSAHDRIVILVEQMLALHRQRAAVRTPFEKTALERQIAVTDEQIDRLVYGLYGLTPEEIKVVESEAS
jgi:hypothetical protein